jgi:serine/threonine protein kinase
MEISRTCKQCGAVLSVAAALDVCPRCVAVHALAPDSSSGPKSPEPNREFSDGPCEQVGARIGRYKLLEKIGEGGCGVVYVAEQSEPVRRRVALKVIKLGMDTRAVIARFEAERQALAMMDHPNIAKVFDGGSTPAGRPYFVMELARESSHTKV